jgi:iron complex transport system substrate-binding protein
LRLAAPGQLVGVSYLSHDPRLSAMAGRARTVSPVRDHVETILALKPDLVVLDTTSHATQKRLLKQAGVAFFEAPFATSLDDSESLIAGMARALGRETAGAALIGDMRGQRRELSWTGAATATAAVLAANRGTSGMGSLMDELLRLAGFRNLAADLGIPAFGRLSLETILVHRPDVLVYDGAANDAPARATESIDHPALRVMAPRPRHVSLPMKLTICAGPDNLAAVRQLREAHR